MQISSLSTLSALRGVCAPLRHARTAGAATHRRCYATSFRHAATYVLIRCCFDAAMMLFAAPAYAATTPRHVVFTSASVDFRRLLLPDTIRFDFAHTMLLILMLPLAIRCCRYVIIFAMLLPLLRCFCRRHAAPLAAASAMMLLIYVIVDVY